MAELKKIILESLESSGTLESIKNDLKSNLFSSLREENTLKTPLRAGGDAEETASELVRDFFETFCMQYSLSVYLPESKMPEKPYQRILLEKKIQVDPQEDLPLISSIVSKIKPKDGSNLIGESINSSVNFSEEIPKKYL